MTWLNPVALLGLLGLAVPILVHLFGRPSARRQRFPSLRLLRFAQPTPATRSRPSDLLLLVVRCLTIVAAAAALAQPRWAHSGQERALARAILIDTSSSMQRLTSDSSSSLQRARTIAAGLVDSSSEALLLESGHPGGDLAGAASWLMRRGGARELVVISDFQASALVEGDLAAVPLEIGTRFVRVQFTGYATSTDTVDGITIEATADRTGAMWIASAGNSLASVAILAADRDREAVRSSIAAVRALSSRTAGAHKVTVVFPDAPARRGLLAQNEPLDSAWQGDLVIALERDPTIESVVLSASVAPSCETRGAVVARNWQDLPVASIARGAEGVMVFACVEPGTLAATALLAGLESALRVAPPLQELEPNVLPDETLRRWERPSIESTPHGPGETSPDGRWLWVVAIGFLLAEEWVRRRTPRRESSRVNEVRHERVA